MDGLTVAAYPTTIAESSFVFIGVSYRAYTANNRFFDDCNTKGGEN